MTFYRHTSDLPPFDDYAMEHRTYRFFQGVPAYPFGFGLSYTSFSYSHASVTPTESGMDLSVEVQNTGDLSGDEVVQVYASCEAPLRYIR